LNIVETVVISGHQVKVVRGPDLKQEFGTLTSGKSSDISTPSAIGERYKNAKNAIGELAALVDSSAGKAHASTAFEDATTRAESAMANSGHGMVVLKLSMYEKRPDGSFFAGRAYDVQIGTPADTQSDAICGLYCKDTISENAQGNYEIASVQTYLFRKHDDKSTQVSTVPRKEVTAVMDSNTDRKIARERDEGDKRAAAALEKQKADIAQGEKDEQLRKDKLREAEKKAAEEREKTARERREADERYKSYRETRERAANCIESSGVGKCSDEINKAAADQEAVEKRTVTARCMDPDATMLRASPGSDKLQITRANGFSPPALGRPAIGSTSTGRTSNVGVPGGPKRPCQPGSAPCISCSTIFSFRSSEQQYKAAKASDEKKASKSGSINDPNAIYRDVANLVPSGRSAVVNEDGSLSIEQAKIPSD
jgi:hypothetical protein